MTHTVMIKATLRCAVAPSKGPAAGVYTERTHHYALELEMDGETTHREGIGQQATPHEHPHAKR